MAEVKESLNNMGEIQNDSFREGEFFSRSEIAICAEIDKRFREDSVCIWFVDDRAQNIDFFGDDLTLDEIQTHLGELEKLAIYTDIRGPFRIVEFKGFSLQSGYIARNILKSKRGDKLPENITIKMNTVLVVDFINPDFFEVFYGKGSALWNFLFEKGGFEDWHGYGVYDVKDVTLLDY